MSIETLTTDKFLDLEIADHQEALAQYAQGIAALAEHLGAGQEDETLDRMARLFTLRKVHRVRLEEMMEEDAPEAASLPTAA